MSDTQAINTVKDAVLKFHAERFPNDPVFTTRSFHEYVRQFNLGVNDDTVSRTLRNLRKQNKLNYIVLNHVKGLMQFTPVANN